MLLGGLWYDVAKPIMTTFLYLQYNGAYGCHACEDGVPQSGCFTAPDWPCITPQSPLRTHESVIGNASEATRCGRVVR